jgi:hypothetical protein
MGYDTEQCFFGLRVRRPSAKILNGGTTQALCSMDMLIGQRDSEGGSCLQLAAHVDRSTVLRDDICADPEPEAGSNGPFCREECFGSQTRKW